MMRVSAWKLSGLSALAVIASLYLGETGLRYWYVLPVALARSYPLGLEVAGSSLQVHHREFNITLNYNLAGFRENELPSTKAAGKTRVVFIGDSFVEGYGVDAAQRFSSKVMESLEQSHPSQYEVVNAGQLYADPDTYVNNLVDFGIALQPDVVVMAIWMGNDFIDARELPLPSTPIVREGPIGDTQIGALTVPGFIGLRYLRALVAQVLEPMPRLYRRIGNRDVTMAELFFHRPITRQWLLEFMAPMKINEQQFDSIVATIEPDILSDFFTGLLSPSQLIERVMHSFAGDERSGQVYQPADVERVLDFVLLAQRICSERHIRFVVALLPAIAEVEPESFAAFLKKMGYEHPPKRVTQLALMHAEFAQALAAKGIVVSDPTAALQNSGSPTYFQLDQHLTPRGHEIVAAELSNTIRAERGKALP